MKNTFYLILSFALLMSILSCFRKKENLDSWLNKKFPGEFELADSRTKFLSGVLPTVSFLNKVTSVVELKNDPDVQFMITWYKDKPDLMVSVEEIQNALEQSKKEVYKAREMLQSLNKNGSTNLSVGVIEDTAYFLVYTLPTIENRKNYLHGIITMLDDQKENSLKNIRIDFMEDSAYQKEFKDIIPAGYWNRIDKYHQMNKTVSLNFDWPEKRKADALMSHWTLNIYSDKAVTYRSVAYESALKWAEKNISLPYYIEPVRVVWSDLDEHDPMAMHFHFPYFPSKPPEEDQYPEADRRGFVSGIYQADQGTFTKIKTEKVFN